MKVVTAPIQVDVRDWFMEEPVFVAGGISNCPNWQAEFLAMFDKQEDDFLFFNPRRDDFNIDDPNESYKQIEWEHKYLMTATSVVFWFPEETLCPITLFELGKIVGLGDQRIYVGCHPNYKRRFDVITQLHLMDSAIKVVDNLKDLARQLRTGVY